MNFTWMWAVLRMNPVVYLKCLLKICTKRLVSDYFISQKRFSFWGTELSPPDPLPSFKLQQNLIIPSHRIITNDFSWMWAIQPFLLVISNNCFKYAPKRMVSSLIFQKFVWGRAHRAPSPDPSPRFFLGLRPRFGLCPQFSGASRPRLELRPRFSGASRPRFGLRLQLSIWNLGLAPK